MQYINNKNGTITGNGVTMQITFPTDKEVLIDGVDFKFGEKKVPQYRKGNDSLANRFICNKLVKIAVPII